MSMDTAIARNLQQLRKLRGISQRKAASELGVSQALLSHYENGAREPGLAFVNRACDFYGVTADYLLGRTTVMGCTGEGRHFCDALSLLLRQLDAWGGDDAVRLATVALSCALYRLWTTLPARDAVVDGDTLTLLAARARHRLATLPEAESKPIREDRTALLSVLTAVEALAAEYKI